jgi:hypothetical protein
MSEENTPKNNPLLDRIRLPGETFKLPSLALFYKNGELDDSVVDGEVHVFPMTTIDEIVLKTPDRLLDGKAIYEVFSRCIPQVKKAGSLLAKDVDYLLACLRLVTYGPEMEIHYAHDCEDAKENNYMIELRPLLQRAKPIDPTTIGSSFKHVLPNGQVVKFRPPLFASVIQLSQAIDFAPSDITSEEYGKLVIRTLANMIESVDEVTDSEMIFDWLVALSSGWVRGISDAVKDVSDWGVNFKTPITCKDCGGLIDIEISTNPLTFFM